MDIVKKELLMKRKNLSEETGGRKVFKRFEIEQKRIQKLREEDKRDSESKLESTMPKPEFGASSSSKAPINDGKKVDALNLPKEEVIRRLRFLKQPVTLFGESEDDRMDRLKYVMQAGLFDLDDSDMTEGQTNDFLSDRKRRRTTDEDNSFELMKKNLSELCDEDKIVVYFNNLLIEWRHELDEMPQTDKRTVKVKSRIATYKQCVRYLNPLFKLCKKKVLQDDIRQALMLVVKCCMKGDYSAARDHYIRIAIGKSAWPIGVTMVGIHERSAREKIHTNSVAHVMNDETTRKYLTTVERLITFCERRHSTMP